MVRSCGWNAPRDESNMQHAGDMCILISGSLFSSSSLTRDICNNKEHPPILGVENVKAKCEPQRPRLMGIWGRRGIDWECHPSWIFSLAPFTNVNFYFLLPHFPALCLLLKNRQSSRTYIPTIVCFSVSMRMYGLLMECFSGVSIFASGSSRSISPIS